MQRAREMCVKDYKVAEIGGRNPGVPLCNEVTVTSSKIPCAYKQLLSFQQCETHTIFTYGHSAVIKKS